MLLPNGKSSLPLHIAAVASVATAATTITWTSLDTGDSYDKETISLYEAMAVSAISAGLISFAVHRAQIKSAMVRSLIVALATATALYVSKKEKSDSGLYSSAEEVGKGGCGKGKFPCGSECCPDGATCVNDNCFATTAIPYLALPKHNWDHDDLTDSKRPRGWMMDKFCNARDYVLCSSCPKESL